MTETSAEYTVSKDEASDALEMLRKGYSKLSKRIKVSVRNKTNGFCFYCGRKLRDVFEAGQPDNFCVDHIVPIKNCGSDKLHNLVPVCWECNASKRDYSIEKWRGIKARRLVGIPNFNEDQIEWLIQQGFIFPPIPDYLFEFEKRGWNNG